MPSLDEHQSDQFTKLVYIGDSSAGKTGSLVSLLADGYKFQVLDMDNGLDSLKHYARTECPDKLKNVEYETIRDTYIMSPGGPILKGGAKAFPAALNQLTKWTADEDPQMIVVVDSLSAYGKAAFEWAKYMNPQAKDPRQWFYTAQKAVEDTIALLTGEGVRKNVIIISHVNYNEAADGSRKGYVNAIGSALGPIIARYFNTLVLAESSGSGKNVKRKIKTVPTGVIDLKTPNPTIEVELPLETGLSTLFKTLRAK